MQPMYVSLAGRTVEMLRVDSCLRIPEAANSIVNSFAVNDNISGIGL